MDERRATPALLRLPQRKTGCRENGTTYLESSDYEVRTHAHSVFLGPAGLRTPMPGRFKLLHNSDLVSLSPYRYGHAALKFRP